MSKSKEIVVLLWGMGFDMKGAGGKKSASTMLHAA